MEVIGRKHSNSMQMELTLNGKKPSFSTETGLTLNGKKHSYSTKSGVNSNGKKPSYSGYIVNPNWEKTFIQEVNSYKPHNPKYRYSDKPQ